MKFSKIGTILLISTITINSWAQQSCPLTNAKLTDLRTAASKLATNIQLSSACKNYEESVNQASSELQNIATQINSANTDTTANSTDQATLAMSAINQLNTINTVFNHNKCGEELAGFLDYAEAFIDVATGMAPFLAIYGGAEAMPWVLGPALGGAAIKSLIAFFKGKSVDMRNPEQSNAFIKNSCSFHNLDLIKSSIDDLQLRQSPKLQKEIAASKAALKNLKNSEPSRPESDRSERLKIAESDAERIVFLQNQFKADPFEGCVYIDAYASRQDEQDNSSLIDRVWNNYERTVKNAEFRLQMEKNYYFNDLNTSMANHDSSKCKDLGQRWLNKIASLSQAGLTLLEKQVSEVPSVKEYATWESEVKKAEDNIKVLEAKLKFFNEMLSDGFNIEYSEIIRSHRQVQDSLFDSYRYMIILKAKGLAQAWLKVKQEDAYLAYKDFGKRKKEALKRIQSISKAVGANEVDRDTVIKFANTYSEKNGHEHSEIHRSVLIDVCNQLRLTWNSWYNGLIHAKAGRDYCVTFDKVINKLDYPDVQKLCFGTTSKIGHKLSSLKNQVRDFEAIKSEADEITAQMKKLSCAERGELSQTTLGLPL